MKGSTNPALPLALAAMLAASLALACASEGSGDRTLLVTGDSISGIPVGAAQSTLARFARVMRDTIELGIEAIPESVTVLLVRNDTVRAVIDSGRVYRLAVTSPHFRTSDSLGVRTPLSRLLRFPNAFALTGEGAVWLQVPSHCGIAFQLSQSGMLADGPDSVGIRELRTLPPNTEVDEVISFGCPVGRLTPHI